MMNVKYTFLAFATAMTLSSVSMAAGVRSSCYVMDKDGAKVQGVNLDDMVEIASVSKIFTSYWAVKMMGVSHRFSTKFHVTPVDTDTVDVHIEGNMDPLFSAWQMQYVISELNKVNVKNIRTLSFDENFAFMRSARTGHAVHGNITPRDPDPIAVKAELELFKSGPHFAYEAFRKRLDETVKIDMPEKLIFNAEKVEFVKKADFKATDKTVSYATKSLPLHMILKEMNRTSNNWAANTLFESLGGAEKFPAFLLKELSLTNKQVSFINGSGDSFQPSFDAPKKYNKSTCGAVLAVTAALSDEVETQTMGLYDVMAVAGEEASLCLSKDERGTVSGGYSNLDTTSALMAKTGTVNPSSALAGAVETQEGRIYFSYIYSPSVRAQIRLDLIKMIKSHKGKETIEGLHKLTKFSMIDAESALVRINAPDAPLKLAEVK